MGILLGDKSRKRILHELRQRIRTDRDAEEMFGVCWCILQYVLDDEYRDWGKILSRLFLIFIASLCSRSLVLVCTL